MDLQISMYLLNFWIHCVTAVLVSFFESNRGSAPLVCLKLCSSTFLVIKVTGLLKVDSSCLELHVKV